VNGTIYGKDRKVRDDVRMSNTASMGGYITRNQDLESWTLLSAANLLSASPLANHLLPPQVTVARKVPTRYPDTHMSRSASCAHQTHSRVRRSSPNQHHLRTQASATWCTLPVHALAVTCFPADRERALLPAARHAQTDVRPCAQRSRTRLQRVQAATSAAACSCRRRSWR
jgi:hypothetical protein